jgi:arylsulfatase A-like enzyme
MWYIHGLRASATARGRGDISLAGEPLKTRSVSIPSAEIDLAEHSSSNAQTTTNAGFLLAICLPAFAVLALVKALLYAPQTSFGLDFPFRCAVVVFSDLLFVLGWAALGWIALLAVGRSRRLGQIIRLVLVIGSVLIVVYGVAYFWVYSTLRMPLTYPLLMMAGSIGNARSSVGPYVSLGPIAVLLGVPVLYLALVYGLLRLRWLQRPWVYIALGVGVLVYWPVQTYAYDRWFAGGAKDSLTENPHWALISSCISRMRGETVPPLDERGPAIYVQEFKTVAERADPPRNIHSQKAIRNVIVVVLESTGTQFLGVYGSSCPTTPCLAAEADNCLVFRNFYSNAGYTLQSVLPLIISIYPGSGWTIYSSNYPHMAGITTARVLHERGYRTAFMTPQMLGYRGIGHFFEGRGFDLVLGGEDFLSNGTGTQLSSWGVDDPPMFARLIHWIDEAHGAPFYAVAWTQQTHHPYQLAPGQPLLDLRPDSRTPDVAGLNRYLNAIHLADDQIGKLFAALRERHLDQNTLVVITGDHGEAFGFPHRWMFHGTALYQESMNVPLILWSPALFHRGKGNDPNEKSDQLISQEVASHVDVNPTILDLLGVPLPGMWQGSSLFDPTRSPRCYFTCNTGNLLLGVRKGDEKYIYNMTLASEELYDLASDPTEQTNLAKQQPQKCKEYRQRLMAWRGFEQQKLQSLAAESSK